MYLWVVDPRQVTFSCLPKRKSPKRRAPRSLRRARSARGPLRSSPLPDARPTRRRRKSNAARARTRSSEYHRERFRCSAGSTGIELQLQQQQKTHDSRIFRGCRCCSGPRRARLRASQSLGKSPKGSGQGVRSRDTVQGSTVARRRPKPEERKKRLRPVGGSFSLRTFSWTSKRKYADRGSGTASTIY
jgi:hypothetical protein